MKLYLSSIGIPAPEDLKELLGKPFAETSVALIPNAKDYYSKRARDSKINSRLAYLGEFGFTTDVVDLRDFNDSSILSNKLSNYDFIWVMGGNTFVLRYEARRSGLDKVLQSLLDMGIVYGGESAGALLAGLSITGIESADEPEFAEDIIEEGTGIVPYNILPHVDNPEFSEVLPVFRQLHSGKEIIELNDSQAVIFDGDTHRIVTGLSPT